MHGSAQQLVRSTALERAPVRRPRVDALEEPHELRTGRVETAARDRDLDREAHLHVGGREGVAREPRGLRELALHEVEMQLDLWCDERAHRPPDDRARD